MLKVALARLWPFKIMPFGFKIQYLIYWLINSTVHVFSDGQKKVAKEIIESIDKEKKSVTFKVIEGDLLKLYKSFIITVQVENHGQNNLVIWTLQYEKLNHSVPDPTTIADLATKLTKDIETHHLK